MAPQTDSDYCFAHDPARAADRAAARKQGGRNSPGSLPAEPIRLDTVEDVRALLCRTVEDTLRLSNSNARSRTLASLYTLAYKGLEVGKLEERMSAMEERLSQDDRPALRAHTGGVV